MITLIQSSFLEHKLTILRNKKTSNSLFRGTMNEVSYLIAAEVLKFLTYKNISVQTPIKKTTGKQMSQQVILVPILRAGLGLLEGFIKLLPDAEKGHIGLYRDENTYKPVTDQFEWRMLDYLRVKGKKKPVKAYELLSLKNDLSKEKSQLVQAFNEALDLFESLERYLLIKSNSCISSSNFS